MCSTNDRVVISHATFEMTAVNARDDGEKLEVVWAVLEFFFLMKPFALMKYDGLTPPRF